MGRSRTAMTLGAGVAALAIGASTATAAAPATGTCRTPAIAKTQPTVVTSWDPGVEGQAPIRWSIRPNIRLVDGCTKGWIRVSPAVAVPQRLGPGNRIQTLVEFRSTKRTGWTKLNRLRTPVRPITYGMGRIGQRGPFKAGERFTRVRVTTTLWVRNDTGARVKAKTFTKTYLMPPPVAPRRTAPKKGAKPARPGKPAKPTKPSRPAKPAKPAPGGAISLPAAPALPSPNGGG